MTAINKIVPITTIIICTVVNPAELLLSEESDEFVDEGEDELVNVHVLLIHSPFKHW